MARRAQDWGEPYGGNAAEHGHDAFARAKVQKGLEQSRDGAGKITIEQACRIVSGNVNPLPTHPDRHNHTQ